MGTAIAPDRVERDQKKAVAEARACAESDPSYFAGIPGATQTFDDKAMLDLWVREQQLAWLRNGNDMFSMEKLQARVNQRVELIKKRQLIKSVRLLQFEMVGYIAFVVLFSLMLAVFAPSGAYFFSTQVKARVMSYDLEPFEGILTHDDMWDFLANRMVPRVFSHFTGSQQDYRMTLIGAIQLQQERVSANEECETPILYLPSIHECYPAMEGSAASHDRYGQYEQFFAQQTGGVAGLLEKTRFVQNIASNLNATQAANRLRSLQAQDWVDLQTRTVWTSFTYYNPTVDLFCSVRLIFELLHTGGVDSSVTVRVVDTQRHVAIMIGSQVARYFPPSAYDYAMLGVEAAFWLMVLFRTFNEIRWLFRNGCAAWFNSVWHVSDFINCIFLIAVGCMRVLLMSIIGDLNFTPTPAEYSDFDVAAEWVHWIKALLAVSCMLTYVKLIKYLQIAPHVSWVTRSFTEARREILGHLIALFAIFNGYALALHFAFGNSLKEFSTYIASWNQMFTIMIGEFDFQSYREANPVVGPLIFMSFMTLYLFILYNMVIAIMEHAFSRVKSEKKADSRRDPSLLAARHLLFKFIDRVKSSIIARRFKQLSSKVENAKARRVLKEQALHEMKVRGLRNGIKSGEKLGLSKRKPSKTLLDRAKEQLKLEAEDERKGRLSTHSSTDSPNGLDGKGSQGRKASERDSANVKFRGANRKYYREQGEDQTIQSLEDRLGSTIGGNPDVGFRQVGRKLEEHQKLVPIRFALGLRDDMSAERVAMRLLESAQMPLAKRLTQEEVSKAMQHGRSLYDSRVQRSQLSKDITAIDLRAGGAVKDYLRAMTKIDRDILHTGATLGTHAVQVQTKVAALTETLNHLRDSTILACAHRLGDETLGGEGAQSDAAARADEISLSASLAAAREASSQAATAPSNTAAPATPEPASDEAAPAAAATGALAVGFGLIGALARKLTGGDLAASTARPSSPPGHPQLVASSSRPEMHAEPSRAGFLRSHKGGSRARIGVGPSSADLQPRPRVPKARKADRRAGSRGPDAVPLRPHMRSLTLTGGYVPSDGGETTADEGPAVHVVDISDADFSQVRSLATPQPRQPTALERAMKAKARAESLFATALGATRVGQHHDRLLEEERVTHRRRGKDTQDASVPHVRIPAGEGRLVSSPYRSTGGTPYLELPPDALLGGYEPIDMSKLSPHAAAAEREFEFVPLEPSSPAAAAGPEPEEFDPFPAPQSPAPAVEREVADSLERSLEVAAAAAVSEAMTDARRVAAGLAAVTREGAAAARVAGEKAEEAKAAQEATARETRAAEAAAAKEVLAEAKARREKAAAKAAKEAARRKAIEEEEARRKEEEAAAKRAADEEAAKRAAREEAAREEAARAAALAKEEEAVAAAVKRAEETQRQIERAAAEAEARAEATERERAAEAAAAAARLAAAERAAAERAAAKVAAARRAREEAAAQERKAEQEARAAAAAAAAAEMRLTSAAAYAQAVNMPSLSAADEPSPPPLLSVPLAAAAVGDGAAPSQMAWLAAQESANELEEDLLEALSAAPAVELPAVAPVAAAASAPAVREHSGERGGERSGEGPAGAAGHADRPDDNANEPQQVQSRGRRLGRGDPAAPAAPSQMAWLAAQESANELDEYLLEALSALPDVVEDDDDDDLFQERQSVVRPRPR